MPPTSSFLAAPRAHFPVNGMPLLRRRTGFTLVELLIVVVVIGILAALAFPKYANTKQRASRTAGLADIHNLATQQESFFSSHSRYGGVADTASLHFTPSPGHSSLDITLSGAPAGSTGYSATLAVPGGLTCGVFVGTAARPGTMPSTVADGTAACW